MVVRGRVTPFAIVAAIIVMIAALIYVGLNRSHAVAPHPPLHQAR
jgi:hypothetical protein